MLQDTTSEHAARERADRSVRELDDWFDLSPVGMVLFDDSGLLVRTNPAFDQMAGSVPVSLAEGDPGLARLLAWGEGGALQSLQPGSRPIESQGWVGAAGRRGCGACARSSAATAAPSGERRYMGIVEDRSVEEERDLAQMQIGAMMDTAGVGIATFEESSGWVRQQPAGSRLDARRCCRTSAATSSRRNRCSSTSGCRTALKRTERAEVRYASSIPSSASAGC